MLAHEGSETLRYIRLPLVFPKLSLSRQIFVRHGEACPFHACFQNHPSESHTAESTSQVPQAMWKPAKTPCDVLLLEGWC